MATKNEERVNVTGLDTAADYKEAEYDLVTALLEAADYKNSDDSITEVEMKRNGKYLFTVHLHPLSDKDLRFARKKSTIYMANPNNKKLPPIEKERDETLLKSWCIYLATTEADQEKIWGNPKVMKALGLNLPVESVGVILTAGEKEWLFEKVGEISGLSDDDDANAPMDEEEYAKN